LVALLIGGSLAAAEPRRSTVAQAAPPAAPTICSMIYKPVCGHDKNGKQTTYSNECMAKAAGATDIYPGPCMADITR
jgi:hypothetical protein